MALFFDAAWFDAQLAASGLSREDAATALGLTAVQLAELWKDQRELKANDVRILAALLGATPQEIAARAGISTPVPKEIPGELGALHSRLDALEREVSEIKALLVKLAAGRP